MLALAKSTIALKETSEVKVFVHEFYVLQLASNECTLPVMLKEIKEQQHTLLIQTFLFGGERKVQRNS